jgi:hypothetical protein
MMSEGKEYATEIEPAPMTLEEAYGSVPPLNRPEDFGLLKQIAREEREEAWLHKARK